MSASGEFLSASEAAGRLGVSMKALRLYEERGLVHPLRSAAGWRTYGPAEMQAASEVAALRALGLSLSQVTAVLNGDAATLDAALATHQTALDGRMKELAGAMAAVRALRARLAAGEHASLGELPALLPPPGLELALDLPWPWGGERFLLGLAPITFLVGPLGSGKTRLAAAIATTVPGGVFVGPERAPPINVAVASVARTLDWLAGEGAKRSEALVALVAWLEAAEPSVLVVDLVEQDLDQPTQEALIAHLRAHPGARPLVLMTRSTAILDLEAVAPGEAILYCPANHSPPLLVAPYPGTPGYEAVATCLASPDVRKRTEGVVAMRPVAG